MSLDYLPLAFRRTHNIRRVREVRTSSVPPLRPAEPGELPLSPAEVLHGMREGLVRELVNRRASL